jgi:hypothetical protein
MLPCLPPFRVELELWDSVFADLAFGPGGDLLVSARFRALWKEYGLTGLQGFDPVQIVKVKRHKGKEPDSLQQPEYYRVTVKLSNAAIDADQSGLERESKEVCPACRLAEGAGIIKRIRRVVLEPGTWTGEDIFVARGLPGTRLAAERFKRFVDDCDIIGATLAPAEESSFDFYPNE